MPCSAKRAAYSDKPSNASHAPISCTAKPSRHAGAWKSIDPFRDSNNGIGIHLGFPYGPAIALGTFYIARASCSEGCQRDLTIGNVVIDPFGQELFAGLINLHRFDASIFSQLANNVVALRI